MIFKIVLWWLIFGTGKLIFRRITLRQWGYTTMYGAMAIAIIAALDLILAYFPPDESGLMGYILMPFVIAGLVMGIRETLSLGGLLAGDWNPFHPKLRFFSFRFIINHFKNLKQDRITWADRFVHPHSPYYYYHGID